MKPLKSVSTSLLGISGDCILALTPQKQLVCALHSTRQLVGVWPYNSLRTYWGGKERFGFKAGRRSPRGEGEFTFLTERGEEIYRRLEGTIKLSSKVPKSQVEDSLPPDPTRAETPVPFIDSEEEEELPSISDSTPPPLPSKPPDLKRLSIGGPPLPSSSPTHQSRQPAPPLPGSSASSDEISETGPAYFTSQNAKSLHQQGGITSDAPKVVKPSPYPVVKQPLVPMQSAPVIGRPPPLDDDTYSHATHDIPQSFISRHSSLKTIPEGKDKDKIYHGLMRTDSSKGSSVSPSHPPHNPSQPLPEEDAAYDVAYPPCKLQPLI